MPFIKGINPLVLCTYEHAFRIEKKGGFDVVIGNPPYGTGLDESSIKYIEKKYKSFEYQVNSYVVFYEKGLDLTTNNGTLKKLQNWHELEFG